jgi:hypothetical protein
MDLCYSRRRFIMAFPAMKQEAFFYGHVRAFEHLGGVPHRLTYDNLASAVLKVLQGSIREEQRSFLAFRAHYLFNSHFCAPAQGHEKGGVEGGVGFGRRNFLVPMPKVESFEELNQHLLASCVRDEARIVDRQPINIGQAFQAEKSYLQVLPTKAFECCVTREAHLNGYSMVSYDTNRYSVPTKAARALVTLKAYPFEIQVLFEGTVLARHQRSYAREQDIFDPLHYLWLLEMRPGAFIFSRVAIVA